MSTVKQLTIKQLHEIINTWPQKEIVVKCKGSRNVQFHNLADFQGSLKQITEKQLLKLCYGMVKLGFVMPVAIWKNKILDGHQRIKALVLLEDKGFKIPAVPIVDINAATEREAKAMVLAISSQYAQVVKSEYDSWLEEIGEGIGDFINIDNLIDDILNSQDDNSKDITYKEKYELIVEFKGEEELELFYNECKERGLKCRVSTL